MFFSVNSRNYPFLFCLLFSFPLAAQTGRIENLKKELDAARDSFSKLNTLLLLCEEWESYSPDTLFNYVTRARQLSLLQKDPDAVLKADYYTAAYYFQKNKLDTAGQITEKNLALFENNKFYNDTYLQFSGLKGNIFLRTGRLNEVLAMNYDLLKTAENHRDTFGILKARIGIGNIFLKLQKYRDALKWYHTVLALMRSSRDKQRLSFFYNNLSILFYHLKNEDSCFYYVRNGIRYSKEGENLTNTANALFLYGGILAEFNKLKEAETTFKEALEVRKKIGDIYYIIQDMAQVGIFYANLPDPQKGIALCKEGLALARENGKSQSNLQDLYEALKRNYKAAGDYKKYAETADEMLSLKDSIYQVNTAEKLAELQTKYELQRKENTIIQQQLAISRQQFAITRKNYLFYGSVVFLLLAIVIALLIFHGYRRKQKLKMIIMQEEEKRRAILAVKEAEEAERKRIAADLHDSLGAYAASIVSNLEFIKTKNEDGQTVTAMQELRNNSLSIVSQLNDTIWVLKKDALSLTSISDRIKSFLQRINRSYPDINMHVTENIIVDAVLQPSQAFHLFQLIQEAINNAVRHSRCRTVEVRIESGGAWNITVHDDGRGMKDGMAEGNGLQNMRERAALAGWNIEWITNEKSGTSVVIESSE